MSMIDGVNKVFVVFESMNSMHFEGYKGKRELVERLFYSAGYGDTGYSTEKQVEWLRSLHAKIDEAINQHLNPDDFVRD